MINSQLRAFRDKLITDINTAELPIEVKRLVLSEIYTKVCETAENAIAQEVVNEQSSQPDKLAE